eukprot:10162302-Ditylum_brightwellii.AAC.1
MPYKADDMKARFPNKSTTCFDGKPNYHSINAFCMQLYSNAGAIPTGLGGGRHGHSYVYLKLNVWKKITSWEWIGISIALVWKTSDGNTTYQHSSTSY